MMLCVIAKLDDASTGKLETLRRNAFPDYAAARPLHGHITIAAYIGDDETRFIHFCKKSGIFLIVQSQGNHVSAFLHVLFSPS